MLRHCVRHNCKHNDYFLGNNCVYFAYELNLDKSHIITVWSVFEPEWCSAESMLFAKRCKGAGRCIDGLDSFCARTRHHEPWRGYTSEDREWEMLDDKSKNKIQQCFSFIFACVSVYCFITAKMLTGLKRVQHLCLYCDVYNNDICYSLGILYFVTNSDTYYRNKLYYNKNKEYYAGFTELHIRWLILNWSVHIKVFVSSMAITSNNYKLLKIF